MNLGFAEVNDYESEAAPWWRGLSEEGLFREVEPSETAGDIIDAREIFRGKTIESFPVWNFKDDGMSLRSKKAVIVSVGHGFNQYCAENETLNIYAVGDTYASVLEAFKELVIYFYQHFKSLTSDEVTGEAEALKRVYEDLFEQE